MRNRLTTLLIVLLMIALGIQNVSSQTRITNALLALYEFNEQSGDVVHDTSGSEAPLDLTIENPGRTTWGTGTLTINSSTIVTSGGPARYINERIMATNQLTFEAWVKAANVTQIGPARIMTLSQDTSNRNATLGQASNSDQPTAYNGRVRSSTTSNNGIPALDTPPNLATTSLKHVVMTRDYSGLICIYVDGTLVAEQNNGGGLQNWDDNYAFGLAREHSGERPWLGTYYLVAVYNRALTSGEVQQNFNAGPNDDLGPVNLPPTADAGPDQTVVDNDHNGMASVTLDGSASINPEGGAMRYVWDSNRIHIPNEAVVTTDFPVGTTEVTLTVIDLADGARDTDTMIVTVVPASELTLFTFDEEMEEIEPNHWIADGISFENGSIVVPWCVTSHLCGPHIEGSAFQGSSFYGSTGTSIITFDNPPPIVGFGVAITLDYIVWYDYSPWDDVFIVDLYGPVGELLDSIVLGVSPVSDFVMDGYFRYEGPPVKTIHLNVAPQYQPSGWYLDNFVYQENPENLSPISDAGNDQTVVDNDNNGVESITLDGSASADPEGGVLRYVWSASGVTIPVGAVVSADFPVGTHTVILTVIDPEGAQDTDTVVITVESGSFSCASVTEIPTIECEALVALYNSTDGNNWTIKDGWLQSNTPCSWHGVVCYNGHVNELRLSFNNLTGTIPSEIGNLNVMYWFLHHNHLSGSIPSSIGNVTNLYGLYIDNNQLSGQIPPEIGNLTILRDCNMDHNQLEGAIPQELLNLSEAGLQELNLQGNALDEFPIGIPNPSAGYWDINIDYNKIEITDPDVITFLENSYSGDWWQTQTIPPSDVHITDSTADSVSLAWTPIPYVADGGYYEVRYVTQPGDAVQVGCQTQDKTESGCVVSGLTPNTTYYFTVQTYTPAHAGNPENNLWSRPSDEIVGSTLTENLQPTADARNDRSVIDTDNNGIESVTLDGSWSVDPEGGVLRYIWSASGVSIPEGVNVIADFPVGMTEVTLTVIDPEGAQDTDTMSITVEPWYGQAGLTIISFGELPEHGIIGSEHIKGATFEYIGSGFALFGDGCGAPFMNYVHDNCLWGSPSGQMMITFDNPTTIVEFGVSIATNDMLAHTVIVDLYQSGILLDSVTLSTTPTSAGSETLFKYNGSVVDSVVVRFTESEWDYGFDIDNVTYQNNLPPVANAGSDQTVIDVDNSGSESVTLNGYASADSDGTIVSYRWIENGSEIATGVIPTIELAVGTHNITLIVTDDDGATGFDTVVIIVEPGSSASGRVTNGLLALYEFNENGGNIVADTSGYGTPMNLTIANTNNTIWSTGSLAVTQSTVIQSSGPATKIIDAVRSSNEVTLEAWMQSDDLTQSGPARVAGISGDPANRNITLGQGLWGTQPLDIYDMRLRTRTTGHNGVPSVTTPAGSATTNLTHVVLTHAADGTSTIYVNGVALASQNQGTDLGNWDTSFPMVLANEPTGDRPWLGTFHLVAVYNRVLTSSEVMQNFAAGADGTEEPTNLPPLANAGMDQTVDDNDNNGVESVTLDGTASVDPEGGLLRYMWSANGVTIPEGAIVSAEFPVGTTEVMLTVIDPEGAQGTDTVLITVKSDGFSCASVTEIPTIECEALVALYHSTSGDNWTNNDGWLQTNTPCSWHGIECWYDGQTWHHIENMHLSQNNLTGPIPSEIGDLTSLFYVFLQDNHLSGPIPSEIGSLSILSHLNMENNQLSGLIPPEFGNLTHLRECFLGENNLEGAIPPEIGNLVGFEKLDLHGNKLESVPHEITNLQEVQYGSQEIMPLNGVDQFWVDVGYNKIVVTENEVTDYLNEHDMNNRNWWQTQTIPPSDSLATNVTTDSVTLSWTPIAYVDDGGFYEVRYATQSSGISQTGCQTQDKTETGCVVNGLMANTTYYFTVQTYTPAHVDSIDFHRNNPNDLWSRPSDEIVASTLTQNLPPLANAGVDQTVMDSDNSGFEAVTLDGSASVDPDGGLLRYMWSANGVTIPEGTIVSTEFPVGTTEVTLTVIDPQGAQSTDTVSITVNPGPGNQPPMANAGSDQTIVDSDNSGSESVTLNGSASADSDGTIVSYSWIENGSKIATGISPTIELAVGIHNITLIVTDDDGATGFVTVVVTVEAGSSGPGRITDGLLALYEFNENGGYIVTDTSGYGTPMNLTIANINNTIWSTGSLAVTHSTVIQSSGPATKIIDAVRSSNEVTLEAWIQSNDLTQAGPARVVGISGDPTNRNITLGQGLWGTQPLDIYDMRLRTRTTGHNGVPSVSTPAGSATTNLTHVVLTHAANGTSTIYINGVALTNGNQGADLSNWDPAFPLVLANEPTGDRPWLGTFHLVAFYNRVLTRAEVQQNFGAGSD